MATTDVKTLINETAQSLGCYIKTTLTATAGSPFNVLDVDGLLNYAIDDEKMIHWYVRRADGQWRMITDTTLLSNGQITLASGFPDATGLTSGSEVEFFMVLNPEQWLFATKEAMQDKFRKVRVDVPIVAGDKEYDLTTAHPWLVARGQIIRMRFRNDDTGYEEDLGIVYVQEHDYTVKIALPAAPDAYDKIIVEAKRYYEAADVDSLADTITMPNKLAKAEIRKRALELIFQTLGASAKRVFGMSMVLVEQELAKQNARWQQDNDLYRDYEDDDFPQHGDGALGGADWSWGTY